LEVEIEYHGPRDASRLKREIVAIYESAWIETPFAPTPAQLLDFDAVLDRHLTRSGFRLVTARDEAGGLAAFAYGYTSAPGGWWRDIVVAHLDEETVREWFTDCYEFVELAVRPVAQGRGVGAALHDALLANLPHRTSVLSTQTGNERARSLYERRGWAVIDPGFMFPNRAYPYAIMGLDLTKRSPSPPRRAERDRAPSPRADR
jgi:GNAT superfamily N-acetyltransferase